MIPNEPHGLTKPFREAIYGWMRFHLAAEGDGKPFAEGDVTALSPKDPRLLCDPDGTLLANAPSIVELANRAAAAVDRSKTTRETRLAFVKQLVAPREPEPDLQRARTAESIKTPNGTREKIVFLSEIGEYIPAVLWRPNVPKPPVVLVSDSRGKAAVAESSLVDPLLKAGYAVLAPDLRGRGETLGLRENGRDNNYHLVSHSIMWGLPLAGRRGFDLSRVVDYLASRRDLSVDGLVLVGVGDDALPALLAAASDARIKRVACAGYDLSFSSQMIAGPETSREQLLKTWNSGVMNNGRVDDGRNRADTGSVIPGVLREMDLPDFSDLLRDRRLLFSGARNLKHPSSPEYRRRWQAGSSPDNRNWFRPDTPLTAELLLEWLTQAR
jgi:hypothetical protein